MRLRHQPAVCRSSCLTWICADRDVAGGGEEVWRVAEPFDHAAPPLTKYQARFSSPPPSSFCMSRMSDFRGRAIFLSGLNSGPAKNAAGGRAEVASVNLHLRDA